MKSKLIVIPLFKQRRGYPHETNDFVSKVDIFETDIYAHSTLDRTNNNLLNRKFITDVDFFSQIKLLFVDVRRQLSKYNLQIDYKNEKIDLSDSLIVDLSYDLLPRLLVVRKIIELSLKNEYDEIIINGSSQNLIDAYNVLKKLNYPVSLMYQKLFRSDGYFFERFRFLTKIILLKTYTWKARDKRYSKLFYFSTAYYAKKFTKKKLKYFDNAVVGIVSIEQLKIRDYLPSFSLLSFSRFLSTKKRIFVEETEFKPLPLLINRLLPLAFFKSQQYFHAYEKLFRKNNFEEINLTLTSSMSAAVLIILAKANKIRTTLFNAGALTIPEQFLIPRVDKYFVWGEYYRNLLIDSGIDEAAIEITGSYFNTPIIVPLLGEMKSGQIGIVSSGFPWGTGNLTWQIISEGLKPFKEKVILVFRHHPHENKVIFNKMIEHYFAGFKYKIDAEEPIKDFITKCEIIIHQNSTLGIESIIQGKLSIDIDPFQSNNGAPFYCFSIPLKIKSSSELTDALFYFMETDKWMKIFDVERHVFIRKLYFNLTNKKN